MPTVMVISLLMTVMMKMLTFSGLLLMAIVMVF